MWDRGLIQTLHFEPRPYQDGRRKVATQDYRGSGRAHLHQLNFVRKNGRATEMQALAMEQCVSASVEATEGWLQSVVFASQADSFTHAGGRAVRFVRGLSLEPFSS